MGLFQRLHTDSSIYASDFFLHPPYASGKESVAWAGLISIVKDNPKIQLFFFDMSDGEGKLSERDSLMFLKIKNQFKLHPSWKMITLSGNFHNRITDETTMTSYLKRDKELNISSKICSLNHEYLQGTCRANFGHGLEEKRFGHPETVYDTTIPFDKYLVLLPSVFNYQYTGFYYTKYITSSAMTKR